MRKQVTRLGVALMATVLVGSLGMNVALLCGPTPPSPDALFLFEDDKIFHGLDEVLPAEQERGAVVAFLCNPRDLPQGWIPLDGRRVERRNHPGLFAALRKRPGITGDDHSLLLPDYRGLAVLRWLSVTKEDTERQGTLRSLKTDGMIGYLGLTLVPREAQAGTGPLTPIVWAIKVPGA